LRLGTHSESKFEKSQVGFKNNWAIAFPENLTKFANSRLITEDKRVNFKYRLTRINCAFIILLVSINLLVLFSSCSKNGSFESIEFPTYIESNGVSLSINESNSSPVAKPAPSIDYSVPETGHIRLALYNATGYEIKVLVDEIQGPGTYSSPFEFTNEDGKTLKTGLYIFELVFKDGVQLKLTYLWL
jgi:hypothetical protein